MREPAEHLTVEQSGVQDPPRVVHRHVFVDPHGSGVAVDFDAGKIKNKAIGGSGIYFIGLASAH
jgi:hypothetical protein